MRSHWVIAGDFNIILTMAEKKGRICRLDRYAEAFSDFIEKAILVDIRTTHHQVASRLDRFLILESLMMEGIDMEGSILPWGGLDHWLVKLEANF